MKRWLLALTFLTVPGPWTPWIVVRGAVPDDGASEDRDAKTCGPRSLYAMLRLSGIEPDREQLIRQTMAEGKGCSLDDLRRGATRYGLATKVVRGGADSLGLLSLPAIVHAKTAVDLGHFMLLLETDGTTYCKLIDGTSGETAVIDSGQFLRVWSGYALVPSSGWDAMCSAAILPCSAGLSVLLVFSALALSRRLRRYPPTEA